MSSTAEDRPGFFISCVLYVLQLVLCYPTLLILAVPLTALLSKAGFSGVHPGGTQFGGYEALIYLFVGPLVGWGTARAAPSLAATGRWIWVPPAALAALALFDDLLRDQSVPWLPELFFATGGNEGLGVVLFTLPACAATGYSIGMAIGGVRGWRWQSGRNAILRVAVLVMSGVALFGVLLLPLRRFERDRFERWSKVRTVIERPGLQFFSEANFLCGPVAGSPTAGSRMLRTGTYLESLGRRACRGDQLIDVDDLPPTVRNEGLVVIEKVRVLGGPSAGLEGWVLAYGLLEEGH